MTLCCISLGYKKFLESKTYLMGRTAVVPCLAPFPWPATTHLRADRTFMKPTSLALIFNAYKISFAVVNAIYNFLHLMKTVNVAVFVYYAYVRKSCREKWYKEYHFVFTTY